MSFEGYCNFLCPLGHLWHQDVYDDTEPLCLECKAYPVWTNTVDQTNGCDPETGKCPGEIDFEVLEPPKYETCDHCSMTRCISAARYKIPESIGRPWDDSNYYNQK